jgi:hypothetical protein
MKHHDAETPPFAPRLRLTDYLAALAVAFTVSQPPPAHAGDAAPPPVPPNIQVPVGNTALLEGAAGHLIQRA